MALSINRVVGTLIHRRESERKGPPTNPVAVDLIAIPHDANRCYPVLPQFGDPHSKQPIVLTFLLGSFLPEIQPTWIFRGVDQSVNGRSPRIL